MLREAPPGEIRARVRQETLGPTALKIALRVAGNEAVHVPFREQGTGTNGKGVTDRQKACPGKTW